MTGGFFVAVSMEFNMEHLLTWFEIPVADMKRAVSFYNNVFGWQLQIADAGSHQFAFIDHPKNRTGGSLSSGETYKPGAEGAVIYLYAGKDLNDSLSRVESSGGKVLVPKQSIGEHGFTAWFLDTEGNRIGMHSEL